MNDRDLRKRQADAYSNETQKDRASDVKRPNARGFEAALECFRARAEALQAPTTWWALRPPGAH